MKSTYFEPGPARTVKQYVKELVTATEFELPLESLRVLMSTQVPLESNFNYENRSQWRYLFSFAHYISFLSDKDFNDLEELAQKLLIPHTGVIREGYTSEHTGFHCRLIGDCIPGRKVDMRDEIKQTHIKNTHDTEPKFSSRMIQVFWRVSKEVSTYGSPVKTSSTQMKYELVVYVPQGQRNSFISEVMGAL